MDAERARIEAAATAVVDACVKVHKGVGPGLLESAYQTLLADELRRRGLKVEREVPLRTRWHGVALKKAYRLDMLVEDSVLVENKSVPTILPIHQAQLLTYLRLSRLKLGFLINWNVPLIKYGIRRLANGL